MTFSIAERLTRDLGGEWHGATGTARCPAHDDRTPSLSIGSGYGGRLLLKCFRGCEFTTIVEALRRCGHDLDNPSGTGRVSRRQVEQLAAEERAHKIEKAQAIWGKAYGLDGSIAARYLTQHRGIELSGVSRAAVRFLPPRSPYSPCLIAAMRDSTGIVTAVQLTRLNQNTGNKITMKSARSTHGCMGSSVVHASNLPVTDTIGVAEGLETALSAAQIYGIPTVAALGAERLGCLTPKEGIRRIVLFVDNDQTGIRAARDAATHYKALGYHVEAIRPTDTNDFNDYLRGKM